MFQCSFSMNPSVKHVEMNGEPWRQTSYCKHRFVQKQIAIYSCISMYMTVFLLMYVTWDICHARIKSLSYRISLLQTLLRICYQGSVGRPQTCLTCGCRDMCRCSSELSKGEKVSMPAKTHSSPTIPSKFDPPTAKIQTAEDDFGIWSDTPPFKTKKDLKKQWDRDALNE